MLSDVCVFAIMTMCTVVVVLVVVPGVRLCRVFYSSLSLFFLGGGLFVCLFLLARPPAKRVA